MRFQDNASSPDLKPEANLGESRSAQPIASTVPTYTLPHIPSTHHTSTPFCMPSTVPHNRTFDVSSMAPLASNTQDAATIVAEVSAAAAAQASKEFCRMREPKITKLKGGYSAFSQEGHQ